MREGIYFDVFGIDRYKHVSAVTDTRLVAETVVPKELGKGVSVVTGFVKDISTITHKLRGINL
jgi:hypothetical protein